MKHAILVAAALAACAPAFALEPLKSFDNFSTTPLDPTRWAVPERSMTIKNGQLNVVERNWGSTTFQDGATTWGYNNWLTNPVPVTEIRAKVTVNALEVNQCATSIYAGASYAHIKGTFFNTGTPQPNSRQGNVDVEIRVIRRSNSKDAAGVLRVEATAVVCDNACGVPVQIGSTLDLGPVSLGQPVTLETQWDQAGKQFIFSRDPGAAGAVVASLPYTVADGGPAALPYQEMGLTTTVPGCTTGPSLTGYVDASFDNIYLNKSAVPLK